jgi:hypothetical protein
MYLHHAVEIGDLMKDYQFLLWLVDRLINVYGENENIDFIWTLKRIAWEMCRDEMDKEINELKEDIEVLRNS